MFSRNTILKSNNYLRKKQYIVGVRDLTDINWYLYEGQKNLSAADLMIEALVRLNTTAFDELVKISDKAGALAAVKPYRKTSSPYIADMARKMMNIQGNGPDALVLTYAFASVGVAPAEKVTAELRERGAVGTNKDCFFKNASPEFCMSISHYHSEALADYINPNYECVWTHHESDGDPYCCYVFKKKSDPFSVLDDLGKTTIVFPKFHITKEQNQASSLWALAAFIYGTTKGFVDMHGAERTRSALGANARKIGQEIGRWLAEHNPELTEEPSLVAKLVHDMYNSLGQKDNFIIKAAGPYSDEITDCSQQQWGCELCAQYEALFDGMVGAINPEYEFYYDRMITQGDKSCHWAIKRKSSEKAVEDPLTALKSRFARGEITKEEYLEMRSLLEV